MHRVELPDQIPQTEGLHPVLRAALANLDIELEAELAHYRRLRTGSAQPRRRMGRRSPTPAAELMPVATGVGYATTNRPEPSRTMLAASPRSREAASYESLSVSEPPANGIAEATTASTLADLSLAVESTAAPLASDPALSSDQDRGGELANPSRQLDDYLESSEELLRSLAEEEAAVETERGLVQSLLTPLGIGSMLLLLLSSTMLGYVLMNPSSLGQLMSLGAGDQQTPIGEQPSQTAMVNPQPNLSTQEFKDLNLDTLSTLKPGSGSTTVTAPFPAPTVNPSMAANRPSIPGTPTIAGGRASSQTTAAIAPTAPSYAPGPVAPNPPSAPVRIYNPPQPSRSYSSPSRSTPVPANKPSVVSPRTQAAPAKPAATSESYPYKVVTHYDNDRTLESVKKVVPDAYVRNFSGGAQIQLGASGSAAEAEARAEQLRKQGISAEVMKQ